MLRRPALRLALAVLALSSVPGPAHAMELEVGPGRVEDSRVWVNVRVADPLETRIERTLQRGAPATLLLHAELWRRRTGWFDRLEHTFDASMRMRYLVSDDAYVLDRPGSPRLVASTIDSLEFALARPVALPLARLDELVPRARYVVVVTVVLKPLSVEDLEEVEGWLTGEAREQRSSGAGVLTALPRSMFDAVRNFVGFGDSRARGASPEFVVPGPR